MVASGPGGAADCRTISCVIGFRNRDPKVLRFVCSAWLDAGVSEVIVINEGESKVGLSPPIHEIHIPQLAWRWGLAVNEGALLAKGELLLITNSDIVPEFHLELLLNQMVEGRYIGPTGVNIRLTERQTVELLAGEPITGRRHQHRSPKVCEGDLMIIRREDFLSVAADAEMTGWGGEDTDLCDRCRTRLGLKQVIPREAILLHLWHKALPAQCGPNNDMAKKKKAFWARRLEIPRRIPMTDSKSLELVTDGLAPHGGAAAYRTVQELNVAVHDSYTTALTSVLVLCTARQVKQILAAMFRALAPGGRIYVQFTDIAKIAGGWKGSESDACWRAFGLNTTLRSFWTPDSMAVALEAAGFEQVTPCAAYRHMPHGWMSTLTAVKPNGKAEIPAEARIEKPLPKPAPKLIPPSERKPKVDKGNSGLPKKR